MLEMETVQRFRVRRLKSPVSASCHGLGQGPELVLCGMGKVIIAEELVTMEGALHMVSNVQVLTVTVYEKIFSSGM